MGNNFLLHAGRLRSEMAHEAEKRALARYLREHDLKRTRQREAILEAFLDAPGHVSSDQLHRTLRESHPNIGYTTVYRTMKLLSDAGLAQEHHFDGGVTRYEIEHQHHDHLVCIRCGKIAEFESKLIEASQAEIAREYGFRVLHHRHELYGHCAECQDD
jgi:Fur family ferric uptake transcriptional regulator